MKVWVRELGHWTDSNPSFQDQWIHEGFDVRSYPFEKSEECEVKTNEPNN